VSAGINKVRTLSSGDFLFRQGDAATAVFIVEQGRLRLERRTIDGKLIPFHTARAGDTFAEAALHADHYHCDAVALDDGTRVRAKPKSEVLGSLGDDPAGVGPLLAAMARQLHGLRRQLEIRNLRSARERILLALTLHPSNTAGVVTLAGPLQDFASELGLTREALYRTLAALERDGDIARSGSRIVVRQPFGV
jgi:CRP-like cAMP-binding protein